MRTAALQDTSQTRFKNTHMSPGGAEGALLPTSCRRGTSGHLPKVSASGRPSQSLCECVTPRPFCRGGGLACPRPCPGPTPVCRFPTGRSLQPSLWLNHRWMNGT